MPKQSLTTAVTAFLELSMQHPEKEPRTQRAQRDNTMIILGFNKAQEALRQVLEQTGHKQLAEVRAEGQQQPTKMGDTNLWIAA